MCLRELQNFDGPHQDIYVVSTRLHFFKMQENKKMIDFKGQIQFDVLWVKILERVSQVKLNFPKLIFVGISFLKYRTGWRLKL